MSNLLWLFAVAIGPVLLGAAIAYGIARERRLTSAEKKSSDEAARRLFDADNGEMPDDAPPSQRQRHQA